MPGTDCGSDHIPMVGTTKIKLKQRLKRTKTVPKLQLEMLENDEIVNKHSISVKKQIQCTGAIGHGRRKVTDV